MYSPHDALRLSSISLIVLLAGGLVACGGENVATGSDAGNAGYDARLQFDGGSKPGNSMTGGDAGDASMDEEELEFFSASVVAPGSDHTCAVRANGSLWCWGDNDAAELGDASGRSRGYPGRVVDNSAWKQVASGAEFSCGVRTDGSLWCWGDESPFIEDSKTPMKLDDANDWSFIAAGEEHACALKDDESLWCWGNNQRGRLGQRDQSVHPEKPTQVGEAKDWNYLTGGGEHTCGLKNDGSLWCWGSNAFGQLGVELDGEETATLNAQNVMPEVTWETVSAGQEHTCGVQSDGSLWCWGSNETGQLGSGTSGRGTGTTAPAEVGGGESWKDVSAGDGYTCAVRGDDTMHCWGRNTYGQLGDGSREMQTSPTAVDVSNFESLTWRSVTADAEHTCGITDDEKVLCWGDNRHGQLGGGPARKAEPEAVDPTSTYVAVGIGKNQSCGVRSDGTLWCWGYNNDDILGTGNETHVRTPVQVGSDDNWFDVEAGTKHVCALNEDDALYCWGENLFGQLGDGRAGRQANTSTPTEVNRSNAWTDFDTGAVHTCAIADDGTLWCWGNNGVGRLGTGNEQNQPTPLQIGDATNWTTVSAGNSHTCGVKDDNTLWCWGSNHLGQLGTGGKQGTMTPSQIAPSEDWSDVAAGDVHTCAIALNGSVWCWGSNEFGQIGQKTTGADNEEPTPTQVGRGISWESINTGKYHTCGTQSDGSVWCWGQNASGQLGIGTDSVTSERPHETSPTRVDESAAWMAVGGGEAHTCAVKSSATLWCWGANDFGQLGDGDAWKTTPVGVRVEKL